jgi:hypothetical protein
MAKKSTIVTLPRLSNEIIFPSGLGAENSVLHLASPVAGTLAPAEGDLVSVNFALIALPGLLFSMFHLNHCRYFLFNISCRIHQSLYN